MSVRSQSLRRARRADAFTLVEILLVCTILVLMTGVMIPRMNTSFRGFQLQATTREIAQTIEWAAEYSIRHRAQTRFVFDESQNEFWVEADDPASSAERFEDVHASVFDRRRELPDGMKLEALEAAQDSSQNTLHYIRFQSDGSRTGAILHLTDRQDRSRWIEVGDSIGTIEILREAPHEARS